LLDLDDQWDLEFGTSNVMLREISRMKEHTGRTQTKKAWLLDMYDMLLEKVEIVEEMPTQLHFSLYDPNDLKRQVEAILPHEEDVNHICHAILGNWDRFITTDKESILAHADRLKSVGIIATSPLKFLESQFMPLGVLLRTLHGPQTSVYDVAKWWIHQIRDVTEE